MLFGDGPANGTAHWENGPRTRGSMGILTSCLVTLGLCVWTSVHLNLPGKDEDKPRKRWDLRGWLSKQQWRKVSWLLVGIFAPEFIAFTAYTQWRISRNLTKKMRSLLDHQTPSETPSCGTGSIEMNSIKTDAAPRKHAWTMTHSFYAVMGGFVFDVSDLPENDQFLPNWATRRTIGLPFLTMLAETRPTAIPDLSKNYIRDKSNGNGLAKAIVCVQATWFVTQCLVRFGTRLPISLFELNTLAHCICALLAYAFWWDKPLDIEEASPIFDTSVSSLIAGMHVRFRESNMRWYSSSVSLAKLQSDYDRKRKSYASTLLHRHVIRFQNKDVLFPGQTVGSFLFEPVKCCYGKHQPNGILRHQTTFKLYDGRDRRRWALASEFFLFIGQSPANTLPNTLLIWTPHRVRDMPSISSTFILDPFAIESVTEFMSVMADPLQSSFLITLLFAGLFYGGLHLLAWNAPFSSRAQCLLWRISGVAVATAGLYFVVEAFVFICATLVLRRLKRWIRDGTNLIDLNAIIKLIEAVEIILSICSRLLYVAARVYLFVEALISFAYLPPGVFNEPTWSYYFPHIT